jgi:hypothetical protein
MNESSADDYERLAAQRDEPIFDGVDPDDLPPPVDTSWITTVMIRDAPGAGFGLGIFILGLVLIGALLFVAMTRP